MSTIRQRLERSALQSYYGVVSRSEALAAGLTKRQIDRRVARRQWISGPVRGWYMLAGHESDPLTQLAGVILAHGGVAWGRSALHLWGLASAPVIPVVAAGRSQAADTYRLVGPPWVAPGSTVVHRGIPTVTVEVAIVASARHLGAAELRDATDRALASGLARWTVLAPLVDAHIAARRAGARSLSGLCEPAVASTGRKPPNLEPLIQRIENNGRTPIGHYSLPRAGSDPIHLDLAFPDQRYGVMVDGDRSVIDAASRQGWYVRPISRHQLTHRQAWVAMMIRTDLIRRPSIGQPVSGSARLAT